MPPSVHSMWRNSCLLKWANFLCLGEFVGSCGLFHGHLELGLIQFLPVDTDAGSHDITGDDGSDSLGRARQNNVAFLELHDLGDVAQKARILNSSSSVESCWRTSLLTVSHSSML